MADGTSPTDPGEDGRAVPDRRRRGTPMVSRYLLLGRRRQARRAEEGLFVYVDRPGGWILGAFVGVVGLSLLDAWYTLDLLQSGATEANPVMRAALHLGDRPFVIIKTVVTIVATSFLCLHKNWPLGRVCLAFALVGYSALVLYHLYAQRIMRAFGV